MKTLKNFWIKLGNEFTMLATTPPPTLAWMMGMLNGFLILEELRDEFEEDESGED